MRIAVKLSLLSSLLVLGVIGLMARRILDQTRETFLSEMRSRAVLFGSASREAVFPKVDAFALHFEVMKVKGEKGIVYAQVQNPSGGVLSHSDSQRIGETDTTPWGLKALKAEEPLLQSYLSHEDDREYFDLAVPIQMAGRRVGTARIGFTRSSVAAALRDAKRQILIIACLATLIAILGTVAIVGWITRPLPMLAHAAREIGKGNLQASVEWKSRDEIGVLAKAFNEMAVANALAFASLSEEKEKLRTLFSEAREGILWVNPDGRVLLINNTARELLGVGEFPVTPAGSVSILLGIEALLKGFECRPSLYKILTQKDKMVPLELRRKEPKLLILGGSSTLVAPQENGGEPREAVPSPVAAGTLWVLRDVTREKREEQIARNVLSLISHKLRTPLMVSLGYQELLESSPEKLGEFQKKAISTIRVQEEKLKYLVEKLLIFASVQNPEMIHLESEDCVVGNLVQEAVKALRPYLEEKKAKVEVNFETLRQMPVLRGDARHLAEAVKNLIENAVKFNTKKEKWVAVQTALVGGGKKGKADAIALEGGEVRISVLDDGPGIPPEEHPKLFRKFYQIDDDFTGQIEGMGLGLAYVRSIAEAHGGKAGLKSKPGEGSEFYFTLPVPIDGPPPGKPPSRPARP